MKNKTLTLIKHKLQWLTLLVALLGVSQGVWGATYPANTPVYVRSTTNYGTDVTLHVWGGTGETLWPGQTMTYLGKSGIYYYWTYTFSYTFTNMIVVDGSSTKISGDSNGAVSSATENCITVTGSDYSWSTYDICDSFSTPSTVLDGTKVMYYINQSYGGTLKVTNDKADCIDENTEYTPIDNNNVYVLQSTGNVPSSLRVSNNCDGWAGAGDFENVTAANAAGARFVTGNSNSKTDATTLSTFTSSASSIKEGTSSITLTLTASKATSSYGPNSNIYAIVYVGSTKKGCLKLSTSAQTLDIDTSDLTEGSYTIKAVLSDGTIYYLDSTTISLTVTSACSLSLSSISGPTELPKATGSAGTYTTDNIDGATYQWIFTGLIGLECKVGCTTYSATVTTGATISNGGSISVYATKDGCQSNTVTLSGISVVAPCTTPPTVYELSSVPVQKCGASLSLSSSQSGYSYQLYQNGIKYGDAKPGTGSAISFDVNASGTYTCKAYYGSDESACLTDMSGQVELSISTVPKLVRSATTVTNYVPVTITSINIEIDSWSVEGEGSTAYFFDQTSNSIVFKASSERSPYTITATKGGCSNTTTITVVDDTETCGN